MQKLIDGMARKSDSTDVVRHLRITPLEEIMQRLISLCALVVVLFLCSGAKAQSTPPLEDCPGYIGVNPVALELTWTASCF